MEFIVVIAVIILFVLIIRLNNRLVKQEEMIQNLIKGLNEKEQDENINPLLNEDGAQPQPQPEPRPEPQSQAQPQPQRVYKKINQVDLLQEQAQVSKVTDTPETKKKPIELPTFDIDITKWLTMERIIPTLGILLLLIGVGFIYKLAYDKGYITPTLVILTVYFLGGLVVYLGIRVRKKERELLSQVLFGGGVAILYITTFAAYQGYGLIGTYLAFVFMFAITFLSFFIALSIDSMGMSIIALLGGLLTPFLVGIDRLGLYGTGFYIMAIATGSMAVFVFKKWRLLQYLAMVGVVCVTGIIAIEGSFTRIESIQFSVLLLAVYLLFFGVEIGLYYIHDYKEREKLISFCILAALPFLTLAQVYNVLELSQTQWGIVFTFAAAKFFVLNWFLYKKKGPDLVTSLMMSYLGGFSLMAVVMYFGQDIRYIGILILSLVYLFIGRKVGRKIISAVGLIIYGIGFWVSFAYLLEYLIDDPLALSHVITYVIVMVLLIGGTLSQEGKIKKILGGLTFEMYGTIMVLGMVYNDSNDFDYAAILILVYTLLIWGFYGLYKKFELLSLLSVLILSVLPFLTYILFMTFTVLEEDVNWYYTVAFIIYGISVYGMTFVIKRYQQVIGAFRMIAYLVLAGFLLVSLPVATEVYELGLLLFGILAYGLKYLEKPSTLMDNFRLVFVYGYIVILLILGYAGVMEPEFKFIPLILDGLILVVLALMSMELKVRPVIKMVGNILFFMLLTVKDFQDLGAGAVTMMWAAYGIIALAYFVTKARKQLANIALGMIVVVAAKFVLFDLSNVEVIWKIVTSMGFGIGLLILSYVIQPMLKEDKKV